MTLSYDIHCAAVERESAQFVRVVTGADPTVPVPSCPGWTLAALITHTGGVHRWFAGLLRELVQERPARRDVRLDLPSAPEEYPRWLAEGAAAADTVLRATDPDAAMWTWGADPHARFWARRMLFETLVHRVDAERALGLPSQIDAVLAADGVDEFLTNLPYARPFAPDVAKLRGDGETILFRCTDRDAEWVVRLRPDGFGVEPAGLTPDATVRAPAADLLLLVYGRSERDEDPFECRGDEDLLARWCANSRF
ncbi:maleylpyruvate isomerase family mycothiol-dependent enzyme [Actinoplanes sp. NPDC049681]|uniref:maleylpyruvate isomerase family mycothiol-dependent enzyme n=1 Tax=Actinoplanes sp. NPDC049681 TaxID=3363905 RepID=UPI0037B73196